MFPQIKSVCYMHCCCGVILVIIFLYTGVHATTVPSPRVARRIFHNGCRETTRPCFLTSRTTFIQIHKILSPLHFQAEKRRIRSGSERITSDATGARASLTSTNVSLFRTLRILAYFYKTKPTENTQFKLFSKHKTVR